MTRFVTAYESACSGLHPQLHVQRIRSRRLGVHRQANRLRRLRFAAECRQGRGRQGQGALWRRRRRGICRRSSAPSQSPTTSRASTRWSSTGHTLAKIFNGTVKTWNAPEITALNSGATLPGDKINVVFRSDESGTTDNFQKYLDAASDGAWGKGAGKTFDGGVGEGAKGNEGTSAADQEHRGLDHLQRVVLRHEARAADRGHHYLGRS